MKKSTLRRRRQRTSELGTFSTSRLSESKGKNWEEPKAPEFKSSRKYLKMIFSLMESEALSQKFGTLSIQAAENSSPKDSFHSKETKKT